MAPSHSSRGTRAPKSTKQGEAAVRGQRGRTVRDAPSADNAAAPRLPMLRTSERSTLKKCEFLWDLEFNHMLKPIVAMPALRFGTLIHQALAAYYIPGKVRGQHPAKAFEEAYHAEMQRVGEYFGVKVKDIDENEEWADALELGVAMLFNYVDEYGADDDWEVLVTEHPFEVTVMHPDTGLPWFQYVGVLDGVWRKLSDSTIWVPDHKSTDGIGEKKFTHLVLDDQAGAYWSWGVDYLAKEQYLAQNQQLSGMMYNFLRKAMPDERASKIINGRRLYVNLDGSVSKKQPQAYFKRLPIFRDEYDRNQAKQRAMRDYARIELFRSGQLPMTKSPGMFTCPSCWARDACELHETGHDYQSFLRETTSTWDPYGEHEVYDGR